MKAVLTTGSFLVAALVSAVQPRPAAPAALLDLAAASPIAFVAALGKASVPAGLEIRESDDMLPAVWPPRFEPDKTPRIPLSRVARAFNDKRQDYRADATDAGVLVIRPSRDRHPFLDSPSPIRAPLKVVGVMSATRQIFIPIDSSLAGPQVGSGSPSGEDIPIVLDGRGRTVIDTLNQIAVQAPGRAWVVITRRDGRNQRLIEFGFLEGDGARRKQLLSGASR